MRKTVVNDEWQQYWKSLNSDMVATMTKLLEKGIEAVRALPADRQDMAGELLLNIAKNDPQYRLSPEQLEDVELAIAEADRGEFATHEEMTETWKKFGR
jgi:hypothetical protein